MQRAALLAPLVFITLCYCTSFLLEVGYICFLCSGNNGVASPVPWIFVYFSLVAADSVVAWFGLVIFYSLYLDSSSLSTLVCGDLWSSTLGILELFFINGDGLVGSASLFRILVYASKIFANSCTAFNWASPTWKGDYGLCVCKAFSRSSASWMAIFFEL